jgi:hypothetical protein
LRFSLALHVAVFARIDQLGLYRRLPRSHLPEVRIGNVPLSRQPAALKRRRFTLRRDAIGPSTIVTATTGKRFAFDLS